MSLEYDILPEIGLARRRINGIRSQHWSLHLGLNPVIDRVSGLYIMIAHNHRIIADIIGHPCIQMNRGRIHKIIIVSSIITLKVVSGIYQNHILLAPLATQAVHMRRYRHQRRAHLRLHIQRIKIMSVHIIRRQQMECIFSILRATRNSSDNGQQTYYFLHKHIYFLRQSNFSRLKFKDTIWRHPQYFSPSKWNMADTFMSRYGAPNFGA